MLTQLSTIERWAYIQSISQFNPDFYICLSPKKILLLNTLLNCLIKVIKLLYDIAKASTNRFAAYYLHQKEKLEIILTEFTHNLFFFQLLLKPLLLTKISRMTKCKYDKFFFKPPCKRIFLFGPLFDYVIKFIPCHPHYKGKPGIVKVVHGPFF